MVIHGDQVLLLLLLVLFPVLFVLLGNAKKQGRRLKPTLPPGPPPLPIVGNLHQLGKHPHRTLWELSKRYGPLMRLQLGRVTAVVVSSAQVAEEVLKTQDLKFCSRPARAAWERLAYRCSELVFSPYNASWRELRKITVSKLFNTSAVEGFRHVREEEVDRMTSSILSMASVSEPVNLSELVYSLSCSIICRAAFGKRMFHSEESFRRNLAEMQALLVEFFVGDYFPWASWVDVLSGLRGRLEKNFRQFDDFYQVVIREHADVMRRPAKDEGDFVDVLLRLQKEGSRLTEDNVKAVLMNIFLAGTDTSYATLEYAMAELIRTPNVMVQAQEEVRSLVGEKGKVEESDISQLNYLKSIVKETLRLHPVVPLLVDRETMDHANINGYDILPKTTVIVNAWGIGRETTSWEKPEEFIPERFMISTVEFRGHDFQFIPFGAGRRICPGLSFGVRTVELALANLLYAFNWEIPNGMGKEDIDMDEATGITVHLKNSLYLKASEYRHNEN